MSIRFCLRSALVALPVLTRPVGGQTSAATPLAPVSASALGATLDSLKHPQLSGGGAAVHGLTLRRDAIEVQLQDGVLFRTLPIAGRMVIAVYVGSGTVSLTPPPGVERVELRRVLRDSVLHAPITAAMLVFADSTGPELDRQARAPGPGGSDDNPLLRHAWDLYKDWSPRPELQPEFLMAVMNGISSGFFYIQVKRADGSDLMLMVDPQDPEPIVVMRSGRQGIQVVSQFARAEDVGDTLAVADSDRDFLKLRSYRIEASFGNGLDLQGTTVLRLTARQPTVQWVRLDLSPDLVVDSVAEDSAPTDAFYREKQLPEFWARLATPLHSGETRAIRVSYHGRLIGHGSMVPLPQEPEISDEPYTGLLDQWFYLKTTDLWFPRYGSQPADIDLTFHAPKRYRLASIGRLVDSRNDGDITTTHWVTERPTDQVCFNIGEFTEYQITDPRIPPVTVQMNAEAHRRLEAAGLHRADLQLVAADVANSLAFFSRVFGPPLFAQYYATEIPGDYGRAFPGLMYLRAMTFASMDESGFEEVFRAHEMAHQWWGIGVEPAGSRDAWLAEGFAEFSGMWYMQMILNDNKKFFKMLDDYRRDIHARRHDAPPIALGGRLLETDKPEDYDLLVYKKGAWVLQMLRNMMIDFHTMNEAAFVGMMQDFYAQYRGRRASTRDFQRVVEKHMGFSMDWFFKEWIEGTAVPTYTLSWKSEPTPDAHFALHLRVRQEDVPDGFMMSVPVHAQFADGTGAFLRITVRGPVAEGTVRLDENPTSLELNPLGSVLAEVRTEGWR